MAIKTSRAITGFLSDDPRLSDNPDGQDRFYAPGGLKLRLRGTAVHNDRP